MAKRYELDDRQWARIADKVPGKKGDPGRSGKDNRLFVHGVLWVLRWARGGMICRSATGSGRACTNASRAGRRRECGSVFSPVLIEDPKNEYVMLDATLVRAHQQAATGKGGQKGERTRLWGVPEED